MIYRIESQKTHSTRLFWNWWGTFGFPLTSPSRWFSLHWNTKKMQIHLALVENRRTPMLSTNWCLFMLEFPTNLPILSFRNLENFWFLPPKIWDDPLPSHPTTPSEVTEPLVRCTKQGMWNPCRWWCVRWGSFSAPQYIVRGWIYKSVIKCHSIYSKSMFYCKMWGACENWWAVGWILIYSDGWHS